MVLYQRMERIGARITCLVEGKKQGSGFINFATSDGAQRFADFRTEEYDAEHDLWAGKDSDVFKALKEAFDKNVWITLILVRVNSEKDQVTKTEAYDHT